jgi:hypothetical protein
VKGYGYATTHGTYVLWSYDIVADALGPDAADACAQHRDAIERGCHLANRGGVQDFTEVLGLIDEASKSKHPRTWCPAIRHMRMNRAARRRGGK